MSGARIEARRLSGATLAAVGVQFKRETQWLVLCDGEDDGERFICRADAENRIEEIREQIEDGQFEAADYEPMKLAVTHQWRSDWTYPEPPPSDLVAVTGRG